MGQRSKGSFQRRGGWGRATVMKAFIGVSALLASLVLPQSYANAATTAVSTIYKMATNTTNGSTAASSDAPGGAKIGTAKPGDNLKWVVSYQNNTGPDASVNVKDLLATAGTYVPGSLDLPSNGNAAGSLTPQYTTNGGTTWMAGAPPSNANGVGFTGSFVPQGTQQLSVNLPSPVAKSLTNAGGDGYNAVVSADGLRVYAVFHHQANDATGKPIYCAVIATGGVCPGWPANNTSLSIAVGSALGTPSATVTAWQNGTFIANNKLIWLQSALTASGGLSTGCLDLASLTSCGVVSLGSTPLAPMNGGLIGGSGIPASNGNYYFLTGAGDFVCLDSTGTASCGTVNAGNSVGNANDTVTSATFGNYVFGANRPSGSADYNVYCYVAGGSLCPGFPVSVPPVGGAVSGILSPILNTSGTVTGVCMLLGVPGSTCWDTSGAVVTNPYPPNAGSTNTNFAGDGYRVGTTKVYFPSNGTTIACYDFAINAACAGFASATTPQPYAVRDASAIAPNCLVSDGHGRQIMFFNALTGGGCIGTSLPTSVTVAPQTSYCGSGAAGFRGWGALTIPGLVAGTYTDSTVTLRDQNNVVISGFSGVTLAAGGSLDLSSIPTSVTSITATVTVNGVNDPSGVTTGQVSITWVGDPPQMCFETTAPPAACNTTLAVTNTATAVTTSAAGTDAPTGNTTGVVRFNDVPIASQCSYELSKTASVESARPGDKVTYTLKVRNTSTQRFGNVLVTDDLTDVLKDATYNGDAAGTGTISYAAPVLSWVFAVDPGITWTMTYSVTVKNPDTGDRSMTNTLVSATPGGNCAAGAADLLCTSTVPISDLSVTKTADDSAVQTPGQVGDVITYDFSATNTGQTTLTGVAITDLHPGLSPLKYAWPGVEGTLSAGQTVTATATYALTQPDVDNGTVVNSAIASGNPPTGPPATSPPSGATVPVVQGSDLTFTKTADPSGVSSPARAGDVISYTFTASNDGNTTLTSVTIADPLPDLSDLAYSWPGTAGVLQPGESVTATATYTVKQADIDAGHAQNTATATGTPPSGPALPPRAASTDTMLPQGPGLALAKGADTSGLTVPARVGDTITYHFTATNTGNATLTGVDIDDSLPGLSPLAYTWPGLPGTLAPGEQVTATATYHLTQADIDNQGVANTATVTGTPPTGPDVRDSSAAFVSVSAAPGLGLVKTADASAVQSPAAVGDMITYSFAATNTGNSTLSGVSITDPLPGLSALTYTWPGAPGTLAPGEQVTATATYVLGQADLDAGHIANAATAAGTPPGGAPIVTPSSQTDTPLVTASSIALVKSGTGPVGNAVTYNFAATNTGTVTLTGVTISDLLPGLSALTYSWPQTPGVLAPGQIVTATATYQVTPADIAAGHISNTASATGTSLSGPVVTDTATADVPVTIAPAPGLTLLKKADASAVQSPAMVGDTITYHFVATNSGNVPLTGVTIADALPGLSTLTYTWPGAPGTLAPGQAVTATATYRLTADDIAAGHVANAANASGSDPSGRMLTTPFASVDTPLLRSEMPRVSG